jgi:lipopolysaccharide export system permease protein
MRKVILNYIIKNFLQTLLVVISVVFCFGVILNLFEEIEFFKNINASIFNPLFLTILFVPSLIIKLLPFIIFVSSMWFMVKIRNNNDLLTLKVYGYSNIKIFFILATISFLFGWIVLTVASPFSSSMVKYYEKTKSQYARDIEHLVTFNKNGLWIKEPFDKGSRIISAENIGIDKLTNVTIFEFNKDFEVEKKIFSKQVNIKSNNWVLNDVIIFKSVKNIFEKEKLSEYKIISIYDHEKITSLFSNSDTMSFLDLLINYQNLLNNGYNKRFLDQSFHSMLSLPFLLLLMTSIAAILTLHTLKKADNLKFIILGLIICVLVYYFKDLSMALGKTDRIPLILSVWSPVIALSLFTFIGVLQINEN